MNRHGLSSPRLLVGMIAIAIVLAFAGAYSFIRYVARSAPDTRRIAVAPFDIFVSGLDDWRVGLAQRVTSRLDGLPSWTAVPQEVVADRWRGKDRGEVAAVEMARKTNAGLAVYGRVDSLGADSVRLHVLLIDVKTTVISETIELGVSRASADVAADSVAAQVARIVGR